jgi:hypothetical protein
MDVERQARTRALNDLLRKRHVGGRILLSRGAVDLGPNWIAAALAAVANFDKFDDGNDPYEEHDFGSVAVRGTALFWKIDYFDPTMTFRATDPADAATCVRVLTLMLAEEY